jgi:hypothetical protein
MDVIQMSFILPLVGFAIYGIDCLAERFNGYHLSYEARDTLDHLLSYDEYKLFGFVLKNTRKLERKIKPLIIDIALKSALEDLKREGANSKIFISMQKEAERVLRDFGRKDL